MGVVLDIRYRPMRLVPTMMTSVFIRPSFAARDTRGTGQGRQPGFAVFLCPDRRIFGYFLAAWVGQTEFYEKPP